MTEAERVQGVDPTIIYDGGLHSTPYTYEVDQEKLLGLYRGLSIPQDQIDKIRLILAKNEEDLGPFSDPSTDVAVFTDSVLHPKEVAVEANPMVPKIPDDLMQRRLNKALAFDLYHLRQVNDPAVGRKLSKMHAYDSAIKYGSIPLTYFAYHLIDRIDSLQDIIVASLAGIFASKFAGRVYQRAVVGRFFHSLDRKASDFAKTVSSSVEGQVIKISRRNEAK